MVSQAKRLEMAGLDRLSLDSSHGGGTHKTDRFRFPPQPQVLQYILYLAMALMLFDIGPTCNAVGQASPEEFEVYRVLC